MNERISLPTNPPSQPPRHTYDGVMQRLAHTPLVAGLAAAAIACSPTRKEKPVESTTVTNVEPTDVDTIAIHRDKSRETPGKGIVKWIEGSEDDFLKKIERGEFTPEERIQRTKILSNGEQIFYDVGLVFYKVKNGDTISDIREALSKYPQFAYLKDQKMKLQSFNIPQHELKEGMWIPIPIKNTDRHMTDDQFVEFATDAIQKLKKDENYGGVVKMILSRRGMSEEKLVASMLAVAKQESGGQPLGCFEFHRWEGKGAHNEFSFSMFHVLMVGPGLTARRNLNMTEGQTYHPENAVKLFMGFLVEKAKERKKKYADKSIAKFFPFTEKSLKKFATFYNGKGWVRNNRAYPTNLMKFYKSALEIVD